MPRMEGETVPLLSSQESHHLLRDSPTGAYGSVSGEDELVYSFGSGKHRFVFENGTAAPPTPRARQGTSTFLGRWKKVNKRRWANIVKICVLFSITVLCSVVFVVTPEVDIYKHQMSVSKNQPQVVNISGVSAETPLVRLYAVGSFRFMPPTMWTNNIRFTMINPNSGSKQEREVVVADQEEVRWYEESTREFVFDFSNESVGGEISMEVSANFRYSVPVQIYSILQTEQIKHEVLYAALILVIVYILIVFDVVHRCLAAMLGALAAISVMAAMNERPTMDTVLSWLDYNTLALLFGMMILVTVFCESGFFDWAALQMYTIAKGKTWPLITILCAFAALVSAMLDNVTTILLLTPITIRLCEVLELDPKHVLMATVLFSNIGGTMTAIGDPPNVIIVSNTDILHAAKGNLNFATFTLHMAVGSIFVLLASYGVLRLLYRKKELLKQLDPPEVAELKLEIDMWTRTSNRMSVTSRPEAMVREMLLQKIEDLEIQSRTMMREQREVGPKGHEERLRDLREKYVIRDRPLLIKSCVVMAVVVLVFFIHPFLLELNVGWIAILGAIWLLILADYSDMESVLDRIEWATLLFFAALFILMGALQDLGLMKWIADVTTLLIEPLDESAKLTVAIIAIQWISAFASSLIDNIPFTTAMIPVVVQLSQSPSIGLPLEPLVYALAFGACLGGNGTLIGASANVVCAGIAENHGHGFTFWEFFKVGFPTMIVSNLVATCYLLVCHVAIGWN